MPKSWYKSGAWNVICDVCGFQRKSDELVERWDGFMVCKPTIKTGCFETRHPSDLQRPPRGERPVPWTRPDATDTSHGPTNNGSVTVPAASSSVTITDSNITSASRLLFGTVPAADQTGLIARYTVGSGTATVYFTPSTTNELTLYYTII